MPTEISHTCRRCVQCGRYGARWDRVYRRDVCNACWVEGTCQPPWVDDGEMARRFPELCRRLTMDVKG